MKLRSSRRLTRSSDHRVKGRAFTREIVARVPSRLPSSGTRPFVLRSIRTRGRELAHSCINENRVYQLRSRHFSVESKTYAVTSRLGLSQSARSKSGPASPKSSSGTRDYDSYRVRPGNIAVSSSILRECSICIESKGKYVLPLVISVAD